jgi:hypothetical protein
VNEGENKKTDESAPTRKPYEPPRLRRWGNLKEITRGGGGRAAEPGLGKKTRF